MLGNVKVLLGLLRWAESAWGFVGFAGSGWLGFGLAWMCGTLLRVAMIELHLPGVAGICGELLGLGGG